MATINFEKLAQKRALSLPDGATLLHTDEVAGSAIYRYTSGKVDVLYAFFRKSTTKPLVARNSDGFLQKLIARVAEVSKATTRINALKAERKQREKEALKNHPVKVGDVFCWTLSYEYTRRHYYQVVSVSGVVVELRPIHGETLNQTRTSWDTVPAVDCFSSNKVIKTKIKASCYHQEPSYEVVIRGGLTADLLKRNENGEYDPQWNTAD